MIVHCAWCDSIMGEKHPLDDRRVTTSMCPRCYERERRQAGLAVEADRPSLRLFQPGAEPGPVLDDMPPGVVLTS